MCSCSVPHEKNVRIGLLYSYRFFLVLYELSIVNRAVQGYSVLYCTDKYCIKTCRPVSNTLCVDCVYSLACEAQGVSCPSVIENPDSVESSEQMLDLEAFDPAYEPSTCFKRRRDESTAASASESTSFENASIFIRRVTDLSDIPKYQQFTPTLQPLQNAATASSPFILTLTDCPDAKPELEADPETELLQTGAGAGASASAPPAPAAPFNTLEVPNYWLQYASGVSPSASLLTDFKLQGGGNWSQSVSGQHAQPDSSSTSPSLALLNPQQANASASTAALYMRQLQQSLQRAQPGGAAPAANALLPSVQSVESLARRSPTPSKNEMQKAAAAVRGTSPANACAALFGAAPSLRRSSQLSQQLSSPVRTMLPQQHASAPNSPCPKSNASQRAPSQLSTYSGQTAAMRPLGLLPAAGSKPMPFSSSSSSITTSCSQMQSSAPTRRSKRLQNREREKQLVNEGLIQIRVSSSTSIRDLKIQVRVRVACVRCENFFQLNAIEWMAVCTALTKRCTSHAVVHYECVYQ